MDQYYSGSMPDPNAGVWPPPPTGQFQQAAQPLAVCPFKWVYRRAPGPIGAKASISDIREGTLLFDTEGIIIQGRAVLRAETRAWILVPCYLTGILIGAIVASVLETACRHEEYVGVRWNQVKEILLAPAKQQACLIYEAPNYKGKIMTFSLAFTPAPGYYDMLVQAAQQYALLPAAEGRLKNATTPLIWGVLTVVLLFVVGLITFAVMSPHH